MDQLMHILESSWKQLQNMIKFVDFRQKYVMIRLRK